MDNYNKTAALFHSHPKNAIQTNSESDINHFELEMMTVHAMEELWEECICLLHLHSNESESDSVATYEMRYFTLSFAIWTLRRWRWHLGILHCLRSMSTKKILTSSHFFRVRVYHRKLHCLWQPAFFPEVKNTMQTHCASENDKVDFLKHLEV